MLSNHGLGGSALMGGLGVASLDVPAGFDRMMFEVAVGGLSPTGGAYGIHYTVVDTQACLVDLRLGESGLSALGCLRLAGASFGTTYEYAGAYHPQNGGALWIGAGARLRWQTKVGLYLEAGLDAVYGTVSSGEPNTPGWMDGTLSAGFRL